MKNALLSCLPSYSYTNNGCNEALINTASQISCNLFAHDNNSLCIYDNLNNDHGQFGVQHTVNSQSPGGIIFTGSTSIMPRQNLEDICQEEAQMNFMPVQEDIFYQPWKNIYLEQSNNELQIIQNARKRSVDAIQKTISSSCDLIDSASNEGTETQDTKRLVHFPEKHPKIQKEKVSPVRKRSQKLTDRITALQKLVSPYGKTDTASVLLEASISIKTLHDQIKDLFNMISGPQTTNMIGETRSDLQNKGLCLVPCAVLEELDRPSIHCLLQ